jgi:ElaA protein
MNMKLEFKWSRLESFTALELYQIIKARESVFVVEQHCPYQETDELDLHAWHLSALVNWLLMPESLIRESKTVSHRLAG